MKKILFSLLGFSFSYYSYSQYCTKALPDGSAVYVTRFELETIDNSSGNGFYSDFSGLSADVTRGMSYPISINSVGSAGQNGRIYVDWNQDLDFDDVDETITFLTTANPTIVSLSIPSTADLGNTRLRLVVAWNGNPSGTSACDPSGGVGFRIGDVEDYTLTVSAVLPVELIGFNAIAVDGKNVQLDWQTATEMNNEYFTIERSNDGINWSELTVVEGAGNSNSIISYQTIDTAPIFGLSYYRLKQTDFDGKYEYGPIVSVTILSQSKISVSSYPNPTKNQLTIRGDSNELLTLKLFNSLGQEVTNLCEFVEVTENALRVNMSNLKSGIYTVKTKTTSNRIRKE